MSTIIVVGIDTIAGINFAATLADRSQILGCWHRTPCHVPGVATRGPIDNTTDIASFVQQHNIERIVIAGTPSQSPWLESPTITGDAELACVHAWLQVASDTLTPVTMLSSAAIFTTPWMFHEEESASRCESPAAQRIRDLERRVIAAPAALIVRSHNFGWGTSAIPSRLEALTEGENLPAMWGDMHSGSTPIVVSDLAEIVARAWTQKLSGTHHVASSVRVTPADFAEAVADHFGEGHHARPPRRRLPTATTRHVFGQGETSLQTKRIRRALGIAMPTLSDGLGRLAEQRINGYWDRLQATRTAARAA